jgi:hypothetical protein
LELVKQLQVHPRRFVRTTGPVWTSSVEGLNALDVHGKAEQLAGLLDATEAEGNRFRMEPPELQFSCAVRWQPNEIAWGHLVESADGDVSVIAIQLLWKFHSVGYAAAVLKKVRESDIEDQRWATVREIITRDCSPQRILEEIEKGDLDWGLWLAALVPHVDLVPTVLKVHSQKPSAYSTYTLGASKDPRALQPLIEQLRARDYMMAGYAAQALGLLGMPEAEPDLIEALSDLRAWPLAHACTALGEIGGPKAIPPLEKLIGTFGGAINVSGCAERAIKQIKERQAH